MRRFFPYFKYLRAVRKPIIGAIVCGLIYGVVYGAGLPLMVNKVIPRIFDAHAARLTDWQLAVLALWLPAVFTVRGVAGFLNSYLIQLAGVRILEAIRVDYFRKLQQLPLSFFHRMSTGDLIARGLGDTNQLQNTLTTIATDVFKQPATLISALCYIAWLAFHAQGVPFTLACLATVPVCVFPIRYVGKKLISRTEFLQSQSGNIANRFAENLAGVKEVRAFGLEDHETNRFAAVSAVLVRAQMKVAKYSQSLTPAIEIISAVGLSFTLIYAYRNHVGLGAFLSIIVALYASYEPIKKIGALNNELKRGAASMKRLEEVLHEPVPITDPDHPTAVGRLRGNVAFEDVTFSYKENAPVLRDVTVRIPAGTVCALVGPSGAGKTTFANLVPRFYEPGHGRITIDGIDLRDMRLADLRRNIALVSQDPVLFNESLFENLLLGRPDASREQVFAAARDAHAHEFITAFPQGYETLAGERGCQLSGGQKQRMAVARAFLRNAPILILDEATSALDSESEAAIQAALKKLVVGKTVLIIAHRFSTIRDASMILVFDRGEIVATGGHGELYAANPLYRSLYDRQRGASG
jgi:subfamily B ATP-binding cassette protein MsbA